MLNQKASSVVLACGPLSVKHMIFTSVTVYLHYFIQCVQYTQNLILIFDEKGGKITVCVCLSVSLCLSYMFQNDHFLLHF